MLTYTTYILFNSNIAHVFLSQTEGSDNLRTFCTLPVILRYITLYPWTITFCYHITTLFPTPVLIRLRSPLFPSQCRWGEQCPLLCWDWTCAPSRVVETLSFPNCHRIWQIYEDPDWPVAARPIRSDPIPSVNGSVWLFPNTWLVCGCASLSNWSL